MLIYYKKIDYKQRIIIILRVTSIKINSRRLKYFFLLFSETSFKNKTLTVTEMHASKLTISQMIDNDFRLGI